MNKKRKISTFNNFKIKLIKVKLINRSKMNKNKLIITKFKKLIFTTIKKIKKIKMI